MQFLPGANPTKRHAKPWTLAILALVVCSCRVRSFAVLGGDIASVNADQARIHASLQMRQVSDYTVHELRSPDGVVVREFAAASGRIFAVSWQGPSLPDLQKLLGPYFGDFQQAVQAQSGRKARGPLFIQQNGLTVQLGGHMRSYVGRAYLSDELPAGVRLEEMH